MQAINWRLRRVRRVLTARYPRAALSTSGAAAYASCACGLREPSIELVRRVFDPTTGLSPSRLAPAIAACERRSSALGWIAGARGLDPVAAMLERTDNLAAVLADHPRAVLLTFHVGPLLAVAGALRRERARTLLVKRLPTYAVPDGWKISPTFNESAHSAAALLGAILWLRSEGVVAIAADGGPASEKIEGLPCLQRTLRLSRGPFFLARRAGVPVIPIAGSWGAGNRLRVEVGKPLEATGRSQARVEWDLALQSVHWLEQHLLQHPDEISLALLRHLATAPRVERGGFSFTGDHSGHRTSTPSASSKDPSLRDSRIVS
jgi:hypothetical protein